MQGWIITAMVAIIIIETHADVCVTMIWLSIAIAIRPCKNQWQSLFY